MYKYILIALGTLFCNSITAQQSESWAIYLENDQVKISTKMSDCHYPEKGVHNRYLLFRIENQTTNEVNVAYQVRRSYNGKWVSADIERFEFDIPANGAIHSSCEDLIKGLHLFASMIEPKTESKLSGFEFSDLTINGKKITQ